MSVVELIVNNDSVRIVGELSLITVPSLTRKRQRQLLKNSSVRVDLASIEKIDTAGLSWLFLLVEEANKSNCELEFINASAKLMKLAELSYVESLLPIK